MRNPHSNWLRWFFQNRRKIVVLAIVSVVVAVAFGALYAPSWLTGSANPDELKRIALGQSVYQDSCASCHGAKLEGQENWRTRNDDGKLPAPPHDESGHTWHHSDQQLFRIVKHDLTPPLAPANYKSDMPSFKEVLSDEEIWAVLVFIKSTWPPKIRDRQDRITKAYD